MINLPTAALLKSYDNYSIPVKILTSQKYGYLQHSKGFTRPPPLVQGVYFIGGGSNSDVDGLLGSLIGKKGKKNFDLSCVDRLKP